MLITCPECQFARNINTGSIPSKAQLATCPRCKTKFRFRILHEEEQHVGDSSEDVSAEAQVGEAAFLKKAAGDSLQTETSIEDDYIESAMVAAMQEEIEELLKAEEEEDGEVSQADNAKLRETVRELTEEDVDVPAVSVELPSTPLDSPSEENPEAETATSEKPTSFIKRSASAQALRERGVISIDVAEAEEEAVKRYEQAQESSVIETASAHIVSETEIEADIWDAIAAMGDEPECTESFVPGCGAQVHIIPWEDSRLSSFGRVWSTFVGLVMHPVCFWRGVNAKPQVVLPMLFSLFMVVLSCAAIALWGQVLTANSGELVALIQEIMPHQNFIPVTFMWSDLAPAMMMFGSSLMLLPLAFGAVTTVGAKLLGCEPVPFSTGVKTVAYSSGAFCWLLIPVLGAVISLIYLPLLYVSGIRSGYNLSIVKSVVLVGIVILLFAASMLIAVAAGVTFM
ncbi:zinc-ribbon domain-containing protein [Halodesulfovibrio aestuarii]|uniref:zinc-ribbon domain-containing protein n=1 Tax=Halodesulfovibrio aestuarii TaxID=126333 RepID=UPI003521BF74